jgi:hypothetical protein
LVRRARSARLRAFALWALLTALYAATLGVDAIPGARYAGDEPHHLLAAESLVSDGDLDLTDEYGERAYADFATGTLQPHAVPVAGRLHEPHGVAFAGLIAPAYALGGATAVQLLCAAFLALAFALAIGLARIVVPDPWATRGVVLVAVSPLALAYGATVDAAPVVALVACGAMRLAVRMRTDGRVRHGVLAGVLLAVLPWLGAAYALLAVPLLGAMGLWAWRAARGIVGLAAAEVLLASVLTWVRVNEVLYGGPLPSAADPANAAGAPTFAGSPLDRLPRLLWVWIDREAGALRWAPILALALGGIVLLVRSRRSRIGRAVRDRAVAEDLAALALLVCVAAVVIAVFGAPSLDGEWFPGRHFVPALPAAAVLVAWGLRGFRRSGAVLAALTVAASAWVLVAMWSGDHWVGARTSAPLGPLEAVLPRE